jgi:hypothetical protein
LHFRIPFAAYAGDVRLPTAPGFNDPPDAMIRAMTRAMTQAQKICPISWHGRAR